MYFWAGPFYAKTESSAEALTETITAADTIYQIAAGAHHVPGYPN
jgi:hypothetical protein